MSNIKMCKRKWDWRQHSKSFVGITNGNIQFKVDQKFWFWMTAIASCVCLWMCVCFSFFLFLSIVCVEINRKFYSIKITFSIWIWIGAPCKWLNDECTFGNSILLISLMSNYRTNLNLFVLSIFCLWCFKNL